MTTQQKIEALGRRGFYAGRIITASKAAYRRQYPGHTIIFNATLWAKHGVLCRGVDLDLTLDFNSLCRVARSIGEDIYVLRETDPHPIEEAGSVQIKQVLRYAAWRAVAKPTAQDSFLSAEPAMRHGLRLPLRCTVGKWLRRPAYTLDCWSNDRLYSNHTAGAVISLLGRPPRHLRTERDDSPDFLNQQPSKTPGLPVWPIVCQRADCFEYIWFSDFSTFPTQLYDNSVGLLRGVTYTRHREFDALHLWRGRKLIGLLWPCADPAPAARASFFSWFQPPDICRDEDEIPPQP